MLVAYIGVHGRNPGDDGVEDNIYVKVIIAVSGIHSQWAKFQPKNWLARSAG